MNTKTNYGLEEYKEKEIPFPLRGVHETDEEYGARMSQYEKAVSGRDTENSKLIKKTEDKNG